MENIVISTLDSLLNMALKLSLLAVDQRDWSERTFGGREDRGPVGPLKHLRKEVEEAIAEPSNILERADLLILLLDVNWRDGCSVMQLLEAGQEKMKINRKREYKKPIPGSDEVSEHNRERDKGRSESSVQE